MLLQTQTDLDLGLWFENLPENLREDVLRSGVRTKIKRGRHLFRQGDPTRGLFGIVSGEAQVVGTTIAGLDIVVSMYRAGDWVGFLSCLDGGTYTFTVTATQPCEVLHLPLASVQRIFLQDVASYALFVAPELVIQRAIYSHIIEHLAFTPLQRLARHLVDLVHSPHTRMPISLTISPITQDQLALTIMASRQWTNRLLQHLEKAGLIARSRSKIEVLDLPRLTQLAIHGEDGFTLTDLPRTDVPDMA